MVVSSALQKALMHCLKDFESHAIPLIGVIGASRATFNIDPQAAVSATFTEQSLDDGFTALRALQTQLRVLAQSEEHTRQALARWSRLLSSYRSADLRDPRVAAAAVEDGALLVYELSADSSGLASSDVLREEEQRQEEEEGGGGDQGEGAMSHRGRVSTQTAVRRMDGIAAAVRSASPHLFGAAGSVLLPGLLKEQLQAVGRQLFDGPDRFKAEPVEWVYDRCTPLLLPELLGGCKKGVPLSLAVLHASVSRRLGMPALPIKAGSNSSVARDTDSSTAAAKLLPTALAAKKAGRNSAAGPPVDPWLVAAPAGSPEGGSLIDGSTLVADPCARGGVSSLGEVLQRYPQLAAWKDGKETVLDAGGRYVLAIWAEYARCMLVAHQRRGESDLVAHWMYQVMALEPAAPEWRTATLNQD